MILMENLDLVGIPENDRRPRVRAAGWNIKYWILAVDGGAASLFGEKRHRASLIEKPKAAMFIAPAAIGGRETGLPE